MKIPLSTRLIKVLKKKRKRHIKRTILVLMVGVLFLFVMMRGEKHVDFVQPGNQWSRARYDKQLLKNLNQLNARPVKRLSVGKKRHSMVKPSIGRTHPALARQSWLVAPKRQDKRLTASSSVLGYHHDKNSSQTIRVHSVGDLGHMIMAGEILHATLESAVNSQLAGPVRAVLSWPAYDYLQDKVLLPVGTRLVGEYRSQIHLSEVRLGIVWRRIILPDGRSFLLDGETVDTLGRSGIHADEVKSHFWARFGEASLYSLLSAGAQLSAGESSDLQTAGQLMRSQVASSFADTAQSTLLDHQKIGPTLLIHPGREFSIFIRKDIQFEE